MRGNEDRRWLIGLAIFIVIVTTIPYLNGYSRESEVWKFSGFLFGIEDGNSYIAKMLNGASGEWLFRTPYTPINQGGIIAFFPYLLLGKIASPPGLHDQLVALFHLFRWLGIFVFLFASFDFAALFLEKRWQKRLAVVIIACGSGLGWLYFFTLNGPWGNSIPLDFYSPEAFGFLELFGLPHLAVARALMIWGLIRLLSNDDVPWSMRETVTTGLIWFGIGFFQPIDIPIGWVVAGAYWIVRAGISRIGAGGNSTDRQFLKKLLMIVAFSSPWVIYNSITFLTDPYAKVWIEQNILRSPSFWHYLMAYGYLLPAAFIGGILLWKKFQKKALFLSIWVVMVPILAYAPTNIQRRLVEGGWMAITILAVAGIEKFFESRKILSIICVIPIFFSTIIFLGGMVQTSFTPKIPAFIEKDDIACYREISRIAEPDAVVLADREASNSLPAWANVRTLIGHGPESAGEKIIAPLVSSFFSGDMIVFEMTQLFSDYKVQFIFSDAVFRGVSEISEFPDYRVTLMFENQTCKIFNVISKK